MPEIGHRTVETNRIKMHIAEAGQGPLVLLCHGFPESWYSWRHQLPALAEAGYHVVAPDQRGYGQTDKPEPIEAYNMFQLVGDMVGLVKALGEEQAVIVGHDWGAPVAWNSALLRPDVFRAVAALSVPHLPWMPIRPTDGMKMMAGENFFYILYFQELGKAEAELEADVRRTQRMFLWSAGGDPKPGEGLRGPNPKSAKFLEMLSEPKELPAWLTEADLDFFTGEFERSGFRGGLNWYRNIDRNWELGAFLNGAKIRQPSAFIAGDRDGVIMMNRAPYDNLEQSCTDLRAKTLIPGCGHWTQQERPAEVNQFLIEFLRGLK